MRSRWKEKSPRLRHRSVNAHLNNLVRPLHEAEKLRQVAEEMCQPLANQATPARIEPPIKAHSYKHAFRTQAETDWSIPHAARRATP
jgi:hypothetical protein